MGGRGATSGIVRIGVPLPQSKYSRDMSPEEYKGAVSDEANFIFRELEQDEPIQIIIYRDFSKGRAEISLHEDLLTRGLSRPQAATILKSVESWIDKFNRQQVAETSAMAKSGIGSVKKAHQAKREALKNVNSLLRLAKRRLKKNYGV